MFKFEGSDLAVSPMQVQTAPKINTARKAHKKLLFIGTQGKFVCENLAEMNYTGFSMTDPAKAFAWLENRTLVANELPDAILCDMQLEKGDAFTFFDSLNKHENLRHIPFIIISESIDTKERAEALKRGIDDFYSTNAHAEDIHNRILFLQDFKKQKLREMPVPQNNCKPQISFLKRAFDIIVSGSVLLLISPFLLLIALIIKLESKGPVFYISKRAGTGYQVFDFYKFRSMRQGADAEIKKLMAQNQYGSGAFFKLSNDPRITRFGHILRRTSLDELPQLINVLKGDMSIVGNRPLPLYEAEMLTTDLWSKRFLAPAGITGLWQVTKRGRKEMSEEERKALDVAYADNSSFLMDLKIILRTIPALWQKEAV